MDWISLNNYRRLEDGGRLLTATIAESVDIHVEATPHQRDIRVVDDSTLIKIIINPDWQLETVYIDDIEVWTDDD